MDWHLLSHSEDVHMEVAEAHAVEYHSEETRDMELVEVFVIASLAACQVLDAATFPSCLPSVVVSSQAPQGWSDIRDC